MRAFALDAWERAVASLEAAKSLVTVDSDSAASRAYYAAFHATTALFACRGVSFTKHAALRAAVHRDLVKTREWPEAMGRRYDFLLALRELGDYGGASHVSEEEARDAVHKATDILAQVRSSDPALFSELGR